jgi:TetR/AcrR family transcriptional regulator
VVADSTSRSRRGSPRRAPTAEERSQAADRTRERILRAALEEFGAKGYSGARTAGIAARAGVNQQLISYYFGGKQGLLDELRRRWAATESSLSPADASFGTAVSAYLDATLDSPDWARLVVWQALGDGPGDRRDDLVELQRARLGPALDRIRRRQRAGEVTAAVDAEFVLLLAHVVTFAPIAMPHIVEAIFGLDPYSPRYRRRCLDQLLTLLRADSGAGSDEGVLHE